MKKLALTILLIMSFISCEKEVFTGLVENDLTEFSKVFVTSNPKGYKLFIDNKYMNVTSPDSILFVSEGIHKLTLKHDIFSDSSTNIEVTKMSTLSINLDMMKNPRFYGKIVCYTNPSGAKIYLNNVDKNLVTPATLTKIYPGEIVVKFSKDQCRDDSVVLNIKGNQSSTIYGQLNDTTRGVDFREVNSNPMSDVLTKVVVDKYNNKWVGSLDKGLLRFDNKKWSSYEQIITSNHVTALLIDSGNRLWVGTSIGLSCYDGISWITYTNQLPALVVTAIKEDLTGNIWIGTVGGLVKYDNSTFQKFTKSSSNLPDEKITCIAFSKANELWVGTSTSGVIRYTNNTWIIQSRIRDYLVGGDVALLVNDMTVDNKGNIWAYLLGDPKEGTRSALIKNAGSTWNEFALPTQFPVTINSFNVDSENNIWISATGGLIKYNETASIKLYNTIDYNFYSQNCTSSTIDKNGDVWVTTLGGGIIKLKKGAL